MADISGFKLSMSGLRKVMKSSEVQAVVHDRAEAIREKAGDGFEVRDSPHKWVARSYVEAETWDAYHEERDNKTLTKALGASYVP